MLGAEHIRIYDGLVKQRILDTLPFVEEGVEVPLWPALEGNPHRDTLDEAFLAAFQKAMGHYRLLYPAFTQHWTQGPEDDGYILRNPGFDPKLRFATAHEDNLRAVASMVAFTNEGRMMEFPHQGLQIQGRPGRVVMFPAYWTHQYRFFGTGTVVTSNLLQPGKP